MIRFNHNHRGTILEDTNGTSYMIISEHLEGNYHAYRVLNLDSRTMLDSRISVDTESPTALRELIVLVQDIEGVDLNELVD